MFSVFVVVVFFKVSLGLHSHRGAGRRTVPQFECSTGKCSDSRVFCCFLGKNNGYKVETGWRTEEINNKS